MHPDNQERGADDHDGAALDAARVRLYLLYFGGSPAPRWREPGTEQGRARMDADVLRLLAMKPGNLYRDGEAVATLLDIADFQGWS